MNNWFVSKKLTFDSWHYKGMQLLHEHTYNEETKDWEDNGRGKILVLVKDHEGGFNNNNIEMVFLTYDEAAKVKQEFDIFISGHNGGNDLKCVGTRATASKG